MIKLELTKNFDHNNFEKIICDLWQNNKCLKKNKNFTMIMPPPNITGTLHMGHALDNLIQDIIIRFKYLCGYQTCWIPGIDHAGIAAQIKINTYIMENLKITKENITKEEFFKYAWDWKTKCSEKIIKQQKKLGLFCNWDKQIFTLDNKYSKLVKKIFCILYEKKLIYKDKKIINWCPNCLTTLSDIEVLNKETDNYLWYIIYDLFDSDEKIIIATTRPETIFGDVAIAVNPKDNRYKKLIGKYAIVPIINKKIPIICDDKIDKNFGTGCVKITPCHDKNDFEISKKHNFEHINLFDKYGKLKNVPQNYEGLGRKDALLKITNELYKENRIKQKQNHKINISNCYRCLTEIELLESDQWFLKMSFFADKAISLINEKKIEFIPKHFSKIYIHWMKNIHDWCISRQLLWGHEIPAYYCQNCSNIQVSEVKINYCNKCHSEKIFMDNDVLDTWFSSALFPIIAFDWPNIDKKKFPIDVLVAGYDIIFFWIARMIFMSYVIAEEIPFKKVLIHGLVRDQHGKKMSKFTGNGIDPIEIIDKYGSDTLRFALINNNSPGNDMRFDLKKLVFSQTFINKIWNVAKFIKQNCKINYNSIDINDFADEMLCEDKWILNKYNNFVKLITKNFNKFELGNANINLYNFLWYDFCDWYIEILKLKLKNNIKDKSMLIANYILKNLLIISHPLIPYVTESLWNIIFDSKTLIINNVWPKFNNKLCFSNDEENFEKVIESIKELRKFKIKYKIKNIESVIIETKNSEIIKNNSIILKKATNINNFVLLNSKIDITEYILISTKLGNFYIKNNNLIDKNNEINKLNSEKKLLETEIEFLNNKLNNNIFLNKAPSHLIEKFNKKLDFVIKSLQEIDIKIKSIIER